MITEQHMPTEVKSMLDSEITCENCKASCCRQEAMLFNDSEVPDDFIEVDSRGWSRMVRLDDGWCIALDRETLRCTIYATRPWICREFELGGDECLAARDEHD